MTKELTIQYHLHTSHLPQNEARDFLELLHRNGLLQNTEDKNCTGLRVE